MVVNHLPKKENKLEEENSVYLRIRIFTFNFCGSTLCALPLAVDGIEVRVCSFLRNPNFRLANRKFGVGTNICSV